MPKILAAFLGLNLRRMACCLRLRCFSLMILCVSCLQVRTAPQTAAQGLAAGWLTETGM